MKRLFLVFKLLLNERFSALRLSNLKRSDGKFDFGQLLLFLSLAVGGGYILWKVWDLQKALADAAKAAAHPEAPAAIIMLGMVLSVLVGSLFMVISKLYYRKSLLWFAHMPVSSWKVLLGVLADIWLTEVAISLLLMLPALYHYGMAIHGDLFFWLRVAWMLVMMPLIPIAVVTVIATLLTWIGGFFRQRNAVTMILAAGITYLFMQLQMRLLSNISIGDPVRFLFSILTDRESILKMLSGMFPPILWAFRGLEGDMPMMLLYTAVSVGSLLVAVMLVQGVFMKLVIKQSESAARKRTAKLTEKTLRRRSAFVTLFRREMMEIIQTPIYLLNSGTGLVIFPLMFAISFLGIRGSDNSDALVSFLKDAIKSTSPMLVIVILSIIIGFGAAINQAVATAVSREGKRRDLLRILPVSEKTHLSAKLVMGLTYNVLSILFSGGILLVFLTDIADLILPAMLLTFLLTTASSIIMLVLDAIRPNLHWKSEMKIYKQSSTVFIAMIIGLIFLALPMFLMDQLLANQAVEVQAAVIYSVAAALVPLALTLLYTIGAKRYRINMENGM